MALAKGSIAGPTAAIREPHQEVGDGGLVPLRPLTKREKSWRSARQRNLAPGALRSLPVRRGPRGEEDQDGKRQKAVRGLLPALRPLSGVKKERAGRDAPGPLRV